MTSATGSRLHRISMPLLPTLLLGFVYLGCVGQPEDSHHDGESVGTTGDEEAFAAFRASLQYVPEGDGYLVEGDIILSEAKLQSYYLENVQGNRLIQNVYNGVPLLQSTSLSYCISNAFNAAQKGIIEASLTAAAADWSWDTGVTFTFTHDSSEDTTCSSTNSDVFFNVGLTTTIAGMSAFYPGDPRSERRFLINPSALGGCGLFKHEMGHILGFRHEHAWRCPDPNDSNEYLPRGRYDVTSIMHYLDECGHVDNDQCYGDIGSLTVWDRRGTRCAYTGVCEWEEMPGRARDIGVGGNGSAWVVGWTAITGGFGIHRWNGSGWTPMSGAATRIDVGPDGVPWIINDAFEIFKWNGSSWIQMPGSGRDIGIGGTAANPVVWSIGTSTVSGGYTIQKWNGASWDVVSGGAVRIDVDPSGVPWVTSDSFGIFKRSGSSWIHMPGAARDITVGSDGVPWVVGRVDEAGGHTIHRYDATMNDWGPTSGIGVAVSAGVNGTPWIANDTGDIFRNRY